MRKSLILKVFLVNLMPFPPTHEPALRQLLSIMQVQKPAFCCALYRKVCYRCGPSTALSKILMSPWTKTTKYEALLTPLSAHCCKPRAVHHRLKTSVHVSHQAEPVLSLVRTVQE